MLQEKSKASASNPPALNNSLNSLTNSITQRPDSLASPFSKIELSAAAAPATKEAPTDLFDLLNIDTDCTNAADDNGWAAFQCEFSLI